MIAARALRWPAVLVGGAVGSVLRAMQGDVSGALWGALTVNAAGAFALGALLPWIHSRSARTWRELLAVGLIGGYTTFSAMIGLMNREVMRGEATFGLSYLALTVCSGLLLVSLGKWTARRVRGRPSVVGIVAVTTLFLLALPARSATQPHHGLLAVAVGGAIGASIRYALGRVRPRRRSTLIANALGTLVLGLTFSSTAQASHLIAMGVAGGLTTFSAFAADLHELVHAERWRAAVRYAAASALGAWATLHVGMWCATLFA